MPARRFMIPLLKQPTILESANLKFRFGLTPVIPFRRCFGEDLWRDRQARGLSKEKVMVNIDRFGNTTSGNIFTTNEMSWTLWRDHTYIDICWRFDIAKTNIESMSKEESIACFEVRLNRFLVNVALFVIWSKEHDHSCFFNSICDRKNAQSFFFGFGT